MAEPFISEMRMWGFNWAPVGWAKCDGQSLLINDNQALYALLGITYGGNGTTDFNLPDMRGRTPVSVGQIQGDFVDFGSKGGVESVQLTMDEMGAHTHEVRCSTSDANSKTFASNHLATALNATAQVPTPFYGPTNNSLVGLNPNSVSSNGGGGHHNNVQPSTVVNFCIALTGIFPPRN
ncbi:phage tail protein [Teredinibacter sp. KSP-S5-2]|uniref:phage tail protein n=1 Tax=Teredinibacter sp. KSP-S5-2 TaxID=3034506 RepID=UPI0029347EA8|nr:tail fiber protein [Teredinibacter sp. KSP-S5-2]WNO09091.1 tail fiber protein [Teredinibacter sp. KSP-S5-2]